MPSIDRRRRRLVAALGGSLFTLGGCLGGESSPTATDTGTPTATLPSTPTESPDPTASDASTPPEQPDGWPRTFEGNVIVLDEDGDDLFGVVANEGTNTSEILSLDADGSTLWSTAFEANDHGQGPNEADEAGWEWSTWPTPEAIYLAAGVRDEWWAVRAFDRSDGTERWSFRTERQLAVRDVTGDALLVTGEEFFVPEHSHDTPEEPLTSHIYRIDRESGAETMLGSLKGVRAATAADGGAYALAGDELVALDDDGVRWRRSLLADGVGVWAAGSRLVTVAADGDRGQAVGFTPDGERQWEQRVPGANSTDTLFVDETLYVGGGTGVVAVRADGTLAWRDGHAGGWFIRDEATERTYTRSGRNAGAATAYGPDGERRWTFDPPSDNAWPDTVTDDAVLVTAITGGHANEPFYTMYAVDRDSGEGAELVSLDSIFSVESVGSRAYVAAGNQIHAYEPAPKR